MKQKGEMKVDKSLQKLFEGRVEQFVSKSKRQSGNYQKAEQKLESFAKRSAEIVKVKAQGNIINQSVDGDFKTTTYQVHYQYLIKQKDSLYLEEEVEVRLGKFYKNDLIMDEEINPNAIKSEKEFFLDEVEERDKSISYQYNRLKAVQYAERWWNT